MTISNWMKLADTSFNSWQNKKSLTLTKLKASADDKFNVSIMKIAVFDTVKNIVKTDKMLVTNIFFSHNVFKSSLFQGH